MVPAVHPLQLYFAVVALLITAALIAIRRQAVPDGALQLCFFALFFSSTAALEPFRANFLTLNNLVVPVAALLCGAIVAGMLFNLQRTEISVSDYGRLP